MSMGVIAWILLGLIAGFMAKLLLGGRSNYGVMVTILVGIAGALFGGWATTNLFHFETTGGFFDLSTWVIAIAGSVVLLLVYQVITGGNRTSRFLRTRR
jgi:uncharacterized membrane protein YeaQ/YmgE (transglycosylase-associated protein family)